MQGQRWLPLRFDANASNDFEKREEEGGAGLKVPPVS
jgi:hypothetical protein